MAWEKWGRKLLEMKKDLKDVPAKYNVFRAWFEQIYNKKMF